jgi:carbon monoxide dehydrogenase subunit G
MKYKTEIEINQPIDKVIELFDNQDNMKKWMKGLESFENLEGTPGEVGAKMKLHFKMGKRDIEMVETITAKNLPETFDMEYNANGVWNGVKNSFVKVTDEKTKYIAEHEFQFKGFMKIIGFLMPGAFKKQSMKYLLDFKEFAEKQG